MQKRWIIRHTTLLRAEAKRFIGILWSPRKPVLIDDANQDHGARKINHRPTTRLRGEDKRFIGIFWYPRKLGLSVDENQDYSATKNHHRLRIRLEGDSYITISQITINQDHDVKKN